MCMLPRAGAGEPLGPAQSQLLPQIAQPVTTRCTRSSTCSTATPTGIQGPSGDSATWCRKLTSTSPGDQSGAAWELGGSQVLQHRSQPLLKWTMEGTGDPRQAWPPACTGGEGGGHRQLPGTTVLLCVGRGRPDWAWCEQPPLPAFWPLPPRFAHQFLDPGTYVFQDNGLPESMAVVLVKEKEEACGPGLAPVQPSSPYQLARHGVLRHRLPNLGPDWTAITGTDPERKSRHKEGTHEKSRTPS